VSETTSADVFNTVPVVNPIKDKNLVTTGPNISAMDLIILLNMSNKFIPKNDKISKTLNTRMIVFCVLKTLLVGSITFAG
jgi:hypothetical protein